MAVTLHCLSVAKLRVTFVPFRVLQEIFDVEGILPLIAGKYKLLMLSVDLRAFNFTHMYFNIITVGHAVVSILLLFNLCYLPELPLRLYESDISPTGRDGPTAPVNVTNRFGSTHHRRPWLISIRRYVVSRSR
jgi:hypothetical protein